MNLTFAVSPDFFEFVQCSSFSGDDVLGCLRPREGLQLGIVLPKIVVDGGIQVVDVGVVAPADAL